MLDEKIQDLSKTLSSDITSLSEKLKDNSDLILYLREKYQALDSLTKGVPKKLESQEALLNKIVESKEFLAKRSEALASELKSLSGNLSSDRDRLMTLEQKVGLQDKAKESRIDEIAKGLVKVEDRLSEIDVIKTKIDEIESIGKSLGEKSISESEFVSTVKSISKRIYDIEDLYKKLDKEFSLDKTKLQAAINQALSDEKILKSTQESLGKWLEEGLQKLNKKLSLDTEKLSRQLEEKLENLNKKLYSDVEKLSKQLTEHYGSILGIKEKLSTLETLTKDFPKKFDEQTRELSDLMGSEGFLTKRIDSLDGGLNNLNEKFDSGSERITTLEKDFKSHSSTQEKRLDGMDKSLASVQSNLQDSSSKITVLKERLSEMEKKFEQSVKKSMEEKHLLREELKKQSEKVGRILRELRE